MRFRAMAKWKTYLSVLSRGLPGRFRAAHQRAVREGHSSPRVRVYRRVPEFGCLLAVSASVAMLTAFELLARRLDPIFGQRNLNPCGAFRPELGGGFRANCRGIWAVKTARGELTFRTSIETDASGHRKTPQPDRPGAPLAVFLGCSFTAGMGVEQAETLPAQFAARTSYRVENWGMPGAGPQQALVELELYRGAAPALAIYTLLYTHTGRAAGTWQYTGTFGRYFPAYELSGDGIRYAGTFADAYPWHVWAAGWMARSALLRRLPRLYSDADVELAARILCECRRVSRARFVVLAWPGDWRDRRLLDRLRGIEVLEPKMSLTYLRDGHPTAESYRRVAAWLAEELQGRWR